MALAQRRWAAEILHFWFHELTPRDWWGGSGSLDNLCKERFRPELEALVKRALAKEAPDRFMDAQQMLEALDAVPSPAAWLTVQPNQRPLAGGAVPAFDPHMAQLPPAPVQAPHAPTPAPVMAQASMSRPSSKGSTLLIVALAVFLGLAAVGIAGGVVAWFVL